MADKLKIRPLHDRVIIKRLEVDGSFEAGEQAEQTIEIGQLSMRNGHAAADRG